MLKKDLRLVYQQKRIVVSPQDLLNASLKISNELLKLPIWNFDNYHLFLAITSKKEIDTSFILSILQGKDKNVVIPKISEDNNLDNYLLTDNTRFAESRWGVPEPVDGIKVDPSILDVVFVPLLAFDQEGNRVGYGRGFYDTFFSQCKPNVIKVGLSIFTAEEEITDSYEGDIALDYCVTPQKTYCFAKKLT